MEDNIKEPIIIDFFGIPGCGKSTTSHELADRLRKRGYKVAEPSYNLDHNMNPSNRKLIKLLQYLRYSVVHPIKSKKISLLVKGNGYNTFSDRLPQCINIATKMVAAKNKKCDFIVFDEGFCQAAISLAFEEKNNTTNALQNYNSILRIKPASLQIYKIYLQLDLETAMQRLKERGESNSRVDAEKDDIKRKKMMEKFLVLCDSIGEFCDFSINSNNELAEVLLQLECNLFAGV